MRAQRAALSCGTDCRSGLRHEGMLPSHMLPHHPISALTTAELSVLLSPAQQLALSEEAPAGSPLRTPLASLQVCALDINTAPVDRLAQLDGITPTNAAKLVSARPYASLQAAAEQWPALAEGLLGSPRLLGHSGYDYPDKPLGVLISLTPHPSALVLRYPSDVLADAVLAILYAADLIPQHHLPDERLILCQWSPAVPDQPARWRALKSSPLIETAHPALTDALGGTHIHMPDRLDIRLHDDHIARWEELLLAHGLTEVEPYRSGYGSTRLRAHAHDLGALYRVLGWVALEPAVRFVQPTWFPSTLSPPP